MPVEMQVALVDEILDSRRDSLGADFDAYHNHVYRTLNFCRALSHADEEEFRKLAIAACFHDIGIWTAGTFDYLLPSVQEARLYLGATGLAAWDEEISAIIAEHHKLRSVDRAKSPLVEVFRRADLIDLSFAAIRFGLPGEFVGLVRSTFPNAGFHKRLLQLEAAWFIRHPLRPLPMAKW